MARWLKSDIGDYIKKILFVLLWISLVRCVFLIVNHHYFSDLPKLVLVKALLYSVRVDIATLFLINGPLLFFLCLFPGAASRWYKTFNTIFFLINGSLLFLSVCDNIYFLYTQRRITYEVLFLIPQSFTVNLVWLYCVIGWYWLLMLAGFVFFYIRLFFNRKTIRTYTDKPGWKLRLVNSIFFFTCCMVAIRGFESRPLSPSSVLLYFPPKIVNLASNSGFNLFYSYYKGDKRLEEKLYFPPKELDERFSILHTMKQDVKPVKPNIVLFVMESFARDYLDESSNFKASTPFLDSLMGKSLVFSNAFNNGRESTHGLVAILGSLPPFMQSPYYHSQYHDVSIRGLGTILSEMGYDCSFFLGDVDNSFGFREFTHSIGIDHYYNMRDFNDDRYYNGAWGIHDENFFLYTASVLAKKTSPFFATIYNVSSHPPFIIPEERKRQFTVAGQNAAQNSISYVDFAYRSFFQKIKKEKWFGNTEFVFVADHFISPSDKKQLSVVNSNAIPFFIYTPGIQALQGSRDYIVQQLDVLPTILQLTCYNGNYMSFGKSVFKNDQPRYAVQRMDYGLQIIDSSFVLGLNIENDAVMYLYNYRTDPALNQNLSQDAGLAGKKQELESQLKAMVQRYNTSFIRNQLQY